MLKITAPVPGSVSPDFFLFQASFYLNPSGPLSRGLEIIAQAAPSKGAQAILDLDHPRPKGIEVDVVNETREVFVFRPLFTRRVTNVCRGRLAFLQREYLWLNFQLFRKPAVRESGLNITHALLWFSSISFILFGSGCFVSFSMQREFQRYGLAQCRVLVGALQLLGGIGLLAGLQHPWVGQIAAGGLALLMLLGVAVRIKIKDSTWQTLPAFAYMLLNTYLAIGAY